MNVEQVDFPALRVASIRRVGPYGPQVGETFSRLCAWAMKNQVFNGASLVIGAYWDCPKVSAPEQCRMDACVTLTPEQNPPLDPDMTIQTLPGGLCATYLCNVHNNNFTAPWQELDAWLTARNAVRDSRPCYEIYYGLCADVHPLRKWVIDIVAPLQRRCEG